MFSLSNRKIAHKGLILAAIPVLFGLLLMAPIVFLFQEEQKAADAEARAAGVAVPPAAVPGTGSNEAPPTSSAQYRQLIQQVFIIGSLVNIGLTVGVVALLGSSINKRLDVVVDNSRRFARREPLQPILQGADELARLDQIFHDMARAVEGAAKRERAILDNAMDVICSLNRNFEFVAVSPSVEKCWNYAQREMIGRALTEFIVPDEAQQTNIGLLQARSEKQSKFESSVVTKDGTVLSVSWSVYWSADEQAYFCVAHDITHRKLAEELLRESEARIRLIIESMPVGLLIVDERGYIEMTNNQTDHLFGYNYDDLLGAHLSVLFVDDFGKEMHQMTESIAKCAGGIGDVDGRRKDGSIVQVQLSLTEFSMHGAKKVLAALLDVSERYAVEQLKKQLVSMVSHDLRTPLTMIQNTLHILGSNTVGQLDERGEQLVHSAEAETQRLIEMINTLLDIEKMQSGRLQMELTPVSVDSVISRSLTVVSHAAEKQRVELETETTGYEVLADGAKLVQVLINLLSNAIKFSPPAGKVSVRCEEDDAGWLTVNVSDQGRGIPPSQKALIFERFHQVELSDRIEKGGTGLGLAICKSIVEAHGGTIGVESEFGRGSTFWFKIPSHDGNGDAE